MTTARVLRPANHNGQYLVKEIDSPVWGAPDAEWVLRALEEHHEDGWEVCGVTPAGGGRAIWVFYRRKTLQ
jgi:hypothetical protein